jgi:hypothetical protein
MTAYKSKVKAVYPNAVCRLGINYWWVSTTGNPIGAGDTAFLAWLDAWRNIDAKINQK